MMQLFIYLPYHLCVHDHVCVLSLFYDHKYYPPDHCYAGLWICRRLGLNSSQHASVFHVPYQSAMFYPQWYRCQKNGESIEYRNYSVCQFVRLLRAIVFLPLYLDIWGLVSPPCLDHLSQQPCLQE